MLIEAPIPHESHESSSYGIPCCLSIFSHESQGIKKWRDSCLRWAKKLGVLNTQKMGLFFVLNNQFNHVQPQFFRFGIPHVLAPFWQARKVRILGGNKWTSRNLELATPDDVGLNWTTEKLYWRMLIWIIVTSYPRYSVISNHQSYSSMDDYPAFPWRAAPRWSNPWPLFPSEVAPKLRSFISANLAWLLPFEYDDKPPKKTIKNHTLPSSSWATTWGSATSPYSSGTAVTPWAQGALVLVVLLVRQVPPREESSAASAESAAFVTSVASAELPLRDTQRSPPWQRWWKRGNQRQTSSEQLEWGGNQWNYSLSFCLACLHEIWKSWESYKFNQTNPLENPCQTWRNLRELQVIGVSPCDMPCKMVLFFHRTNWGYRKTGTIGTVATSQHHGPFGHEPRCSKNRPGSVASASEEEQHPQEVAAGATWAEPNPLIILPQPLDESTMKEKIPEINVAQDRRTSSSSYESIIWNHERLDRLQFQCLSQRKDHLSFCMDCWEYRTKRFSCTHLWHLHLFT